MDAYFTGRVYVAVIGVAFNFHAMAQVLMEVTCGRAFVTIELSRHGAFFIRIAGAHVYAVGGTEVHFVRTFVTGSCDGPYC